MMTVRKSPYTSTEDTAQKGRRPHIYYINIHQESKLIMEGHRIEKGRDG